MLHTIANMHYKSQALSMKSDKCTKNIAFIKKILKFRTHEIVIALKFEQCGSVIE